MARESCTWRRRSVRTTTACRTVRAVCCARADRRPLRARSAVEDAAVRALLSALRALRDAAALLRQILLVHRHVEASRRATCGERDRSVVPAARQARPLRGLAEEQR